MKNNKALGIAIVCQHSSANGRRKMLMQKRFFLLQFRVALQCAKQTNENVVAIEGISTLTPRCPRWCTAGRKLFSERMLPDITIKTLGSKPESLVFTMSTGPTGTLAMGAAEKSPASNLSKRVIHAKSTGNFGKLNLGRMGRPKLEVSLISTNLFTRNRLIVHSD